MSAFREDLADADRDEVVDRLASIHPDASIGVYVAPLAVSSGLYIEGDLDQAQVDAALAGWTPSGAGAQADWRTIPVAADVIVNNSTALVVAQAKATLPSTRYRFHLEMSYTTNAAADFKYRHTGTAILGCRRLSLRSGAAFAPVYAVPSAALDVADVRLLGSGGSAWVIEDLMLITGAGSGSLEFQFAQDVATVFDTLVSQGSELRYRIA
jgi:hypothetical protein